MKENYLLQITFRYQKNLSFDKFKETEESAIIGIFNSLDITMKNGNLALKKLSSFFSISEEEKFFQFFVIEEEEKVFQNKTNVTNINHPTKGIIFVMEIQPTKESCKCLDLKSFDNLFNKIIKSQEEYFQYKRKFI